MRELGVLGLDKDFGWAVFFGIAKWGPYSHWRFLMKMLTLSAALLLSMLSASLAQAPNAEQKALDTITAKAQDPKTPQTPAVTQQQLNSWAKQFGGSVLQTNVDDPDPTSKTPPTARALIKCASGPVKPGHQCKLVMAEQSGNGKMTCTYACS